MKVEEDRALSEICTLGVGGPARAFATVKSVPDVQEALAYAREAKLPYVVVGKGSNCLFDDRGFDGLVIYNRIDFCETDWRVGSGFSFSLLGIRTARAGWTGLEFASGIPGSVGGAVVMNAGANGQETADVLLKVEGVLPTGELKVWERSELEYGYRSSSFQGMGVVVTGAAFGLEKRAAARSRQLEILGYRKETQPLKDKSAGCMFRNPTGASAGKLIEESGCKGLSVGGAAVSDKHANFIINANDATSNDIRALIEQVTRRVKRRSGYQLQSEVKYVPFDGGYDAFSR